MKTLPMLTSTLRSANSRLIRAMLFGRQNDCQYLDRLNANGQIRFGGASEGVSAASVDFPDNHRLLLSGFAWSLGYYEIDLVGKMSARKQLNT